MILSDRSIKNKIESGDLVIKPFDPNSLQPSTVDMILSKKIRVFDNHKLAFVDVRQFSEISHQIEVDDKEGFIVHPGEFILGETLEYVEIPNDIVGELHGRSSLGRLGLMIHTTAGFVDPGFRGTLTLEISNVSRVPIRLYPGMRIAQIVFYTTTTPVDKPYGKIKGSKYQKQRGPTESMIHKDFS